MIIMTPFMQFFSSAFFNALNTMTTDTLFGIATFIFTIIVYAAMCWMVINMILHAIIQVPNGIMRLIGGMDGTNMRAGQEMESSVKGAVMIGMNKTVDAAQAGKGAMRNKREQKYQEAMMKKQGGGDGSGGAMTRGQLPNNKKSNNDS